MAKLPKLSPKQEMFVKEYLIDLNGKQAAIRAGYSPKTAEVQASQLLSKLKVRAHVEKAMAERSKRTGINADRVLMELARIGLINPRNLIDLSKGQVINGANEDDLSAIASVKVKTSTFESGETVEREIKLYDKIKALELLGKHLGMFTDKLEVNGNMDMNVNNPFEGLSTEELRKIAATVDDDEEGK